MEDTKRVRLEMTSLEQEWRERADVVDYLIEEGAVTLISLVVLSTSGHVLTALMVGPEAQTRDMLALRQALSDESDDLPRTAVLQKAAVEAALANESSPDADSVEPAEPK